MTTKRIPYDAVEDIPNLDKKALSGKKTDQQMRDLLNSTRFCVKHPSNLKKPSFYKLPISEIITNQLYMFSITHYSIRVVVAAAIKSKFYPLVADALSLAREQVEKVFIIATLLDNPNTAFRQYWRSSWRVRYEKYLLDQEEHKENERFKEFLKDTTPKRLERMRRDPVLKVILISRYAERMLRYNWDNPYGKNPPWFRKTKSQGKPKNVSSYLREYFEFATPGQGMKKIREVPLKRFLFRWHKEYRGLSQYTHVTLTKIGFAEMLKARDMASQQPIKDYAIERAISAINVSYTAAASACLLVANEVSNDYGAKNETKEFWRTLIEFSLLSKALWKMYVQKRI